MVIIRRCSIIKYLKKKGLAPKLNRDDMVSTLEDDAAVFLTVQKWAAKVRRTRVSLENDPGFWIPANATSKGNTDCVHPIKYKSNNQCY